MTKRQADYYVREFETVDVPARAFEAEGARFSWKVAYDVPVGDVVETLVAGNASTCIWALASLRWIRKGINP